MDFLRRHLFDLAGAPIAIWLQWAFARRLSKLVAPQWQTTVQSAGIASAALVFLAFALALPGVGDRMPYSPVIEWMKAAGLSLAICAVGAWAIDLAGRRISQYASTPAIENPGRRQALLAGRAVAMSVPALMLGYGAFIERRQIRLTESRIAIPGLHKDLEGLRIVQLTDLHFGAFFGAADLRHAIGLANDTRAHVALVTGDLISIHSDPLDECVNLLRGLKSEAGTLGCLGNHEIVARCEDYATRSGAAAGIQFLRNQAKPLRFGEAWLNLGGVDYQPKHKPYLTQAAPLLRNASLNLLLSHNPDVFPKAAAQGWDLTIAGHTHGGQITVEILGVDANPARFYTPYTYGNYKKDGRQINVSRGLGTVGIPSRFGAPPEVSLLTLCAT